MNKLISVLVLIALSGNVFGMAFPDTRPEAVIHKNMVCSNLSIAAESLISDATTHMFSQLTAKEKLAKITEAKVILEKQVKLDCDTTG